MTMVEALEPAKIVKLSTLEAVYVRKQIRWETRKRCIRAAFFIIIKLCFYSVSWLLKRVKQSLEQGG